MPKAKEVRTVPIGEWGKDHWSMLGYIESCCVDSRGVLDLRRVRCNPRRHPHLALAQHVTKPGSYPYPTRLADGAEEPEHDDWHCFYDIEAAGLLRDIGTGIRPVAKLTMLGEAIAAQLRRHKASGGSFKSFRATQAA